MLIGGDLGFFFSAVLVVVGWLLTRRKWRQGSARKAEIMRLMALASEEAARAEFEETSSYKIYASSLAPEPVAVESVGRKLQYQCEVCFRPTTTRCKQCKAVRYCSRNCQVIHWRQGHKDKCHSLTTSQNIGVGVDSCIKEFEQDGSNQNATEFGEMHTTEPVESSPETCMVPKPNFNDIGDNVDIETEVSNRKRVDLNVKASFHSLSDKCSSSTISTEKSVASDNSLNDYNRYYGQITSEVKSTRSPKSEQHSLTSNELDRAASSVSNQVQLVQTNADEKSESTILSGSSAAYSEEAEYSTISSDFWTGTVERTRHRSNALDEFDDVNMSNSHISVSPSASRINIDAEMYVSGMNKVSADDPCLVTSIPKKSIAPLSQVSEDGLDSREQLSLGCKLPDPYGDSNTSTKCSSTKGSNLSSFSSRRGGISEGHVPSTNIDVSSLQSLVPIKLVDESDRTHLILDTLKCPRNNSSSLGSTESHLSSNQVLKSVENDCTCDNDVCSSESSSYVQSATSGANLSMKRNVGQLRASDFISRGSLSAGRGIMRRYEGYFPYELFVKLYNWNNAELSPCGLINCGNSCYANAVLQCLAFTPPLAAYCLQGLHSKTCRKKEWCFTCEFEELVKKAKEGNNPVSPARIMSQIQCMGSHLGNGREEDAHEFLRYAIEVMQSVCLKEAKVDVPSSLVEETTLLGLTFGGYLQSKIECMRCGGKSKQNDRIMDLTAEIEGNIGSLEDALLQFTNSEILDGENKYHCGRCKSYEKAKKKLRVLEAPNVLVIALKRFQTGKFGKLNKVIKFPEILNLAPYMSGTSDKSPIYQLYGVVVHLDVMNAVFSGHYVCYIKNKQGRWFKADDSVVQEVELENVLSNDAYILFYARCSPRAPRVIRSSMGSRKAKNLSCNVKPHPWDSSMGGSTSSNGYFGRAHPTEESSSEYSSSYFSEGGSYSTESTYRESVSTTDDNFDRILGDSLRHIDFDCCSDTESTSSCSVNMSPKMQVRDGFQVCGSRKEDLLGFKSRGTFLCSRVGNCSCSSSNRLGSNSSCNNVRDVYL